MGEACEFDMWAIPPAIPQAEARWNSCPSRDQMHAGVHDCRLRQRTILPARACLLSGLVSTAPKSKVTGQSGWVQVMHSTGSFAHSGRSKPIDNHFAGTYRRTDWW